jgi:multidrug resistance efflux pump
MNEIKDYLNIGKKVTMKTKRSLTFVLLATALLLAACGSNQATPEPFSTPVTDNTVIAEGHLVPRDDLYLSFQVRGKVAELLVQKGEQVKQGQVLVRLADQESAQAALTSAKLEQTSAQQAYDDFVRNADFAHAQAWQDYLKAQIARADAQAAWDALNQDSIDTKIDEAEAVVEDKKSALQDAQDEFDKYKDLNKDNATRKRAKDDLDKAQKDYDEAVAKWDEAQRERDSVRAELDQALAAETEAKRKFDLTASGPDQEQLDQLQARLDNAKAQVAAAQNNLDDYELKAPFDGTVADINVSVNEMVGPEKWAVLVADFSQWYVDTSDLTELEVVKLTQGQVAAIVPDALPDVRLTGAVTEISQSYKSQGGDILYTVRLKVDDVDPRLRWGMTVEVTFQP